MYRNLQTMPRFEPVQPLLLRAPPPHTLQPSDMVTNPMKISANALKAFAKSYGPGKNL